MRLNAKEKLARIKLIVSDMDGTLIDHYNQVPAKTMESILKLESTRRGYFAIGTGRCRGSARAIFPKAFGFDSRPGVFLNGCTVFDHEGNMIENLTIEPEILQELLKEIVSHQPHRLVVTFCSGDRAFSFSDNAFAHYLFAKYNDPKPEMLSSDNEYPINMISILCRCSEDLQTWLLPEMKLFASKFNLQVVNSIPNLVTLLPEKAGKGFGLKVLANHYGLELHEVAAVGDANNDLDMLKIAGLAVAVGNATHDVKEIAHWIVNEHAHEELPGVAQLIEGVLNSIETI
jgi:Cof subfamily protein (haloacid dehalogenase superfamily)